MRFVCIVLLAFALCSKASTEGSVSIKLVKKPLTAERLAAQRKSLDAKLLGNLQHDGEDIPLLDFMDAQVCLEPELQSAVARTLDSQSGKMALAKVLNNVFVVCRRPYAR